MNPTSPHHASARATASHVGQRAPCKRQAGLSLIELMIAITLGLLVMAAVTTLFVATSRSNNELAKTNAQIENGRFAIQILQNDVVHGGFWGGHLPQFDDLTLEADPDDVPALQLPANTLPAPCVSYASWDAQDGSADSDNSDYKAKLIGAPVQAYDSVPTGCNAVVANKQANTDVLVVRHAATCVAGVGSCDDIDEDGLYFQSSRCENEITAGSPYIFMLEPAVDDTASNLTLKKRSCTGTPPATAGTVADIRKYVSSMYYIRNYAATVGDGIPTLMRSEYGLAGGALNFQAPVALIEGIEGFRVEFGVDYISDDGTNIITGSDPANPDNLEYIKEINWADPDNLVSPRNRGDGSVDLFVRGPNATMAQLANVVAVKIYVLARANRPTPGYIDTKTYNLGTTTLGPYNDGYKRHVFTTTVRLNNVSGRRETP